MEINKNKNFPLLSYLYIFFLIINSGTFISVLGYNSEFLLISYILLVILSLLYGKVYLTKTFKSIMLCFGIFTIFFSIQSLFNGNLSSLISLQFFVFLLKILFSVHIIVHFFYHKNQILFIQN